MADDFKNENNNEPENKNDNGGNTNPPPRSPYEEWLAAYNKAHNNENGSADAPKDDQPSQNNQDGGSQPPQNDNPYGGNQPPQNNNPYGGNQPPQNNNSYGGNQPPQNNNPYGGNQPPQNNNQYGGNQPPQNNNPYGGNQPPQNNNPYGNSGKPPKNNSGGPKALAAVVVVVFLIVAGLAGWVMMLANENRLNNNESKGESSSKVSDDSSKDVSQYVSVESSNTTKPTNVNNPTGNTNPTSGGTSNSTDGSTLPKTTVDIEEPKTTQPNSTIIDNVDLTALYNKCAVSCVSIKCTIKSTSSFYGSYESTALGSGFFVTDDGYVVTNFHVIDGATKINVVFYDGTELEAKLVGADSICDIAVLKVTPDRDITPVKFGNSDNVVVGEKVIAIGTPSALELCGSMTYGVISGVQRKIDLTNDYGTVTKTMTLLQTDATLNPGNSGGPLFNMEGQVIGINTLKLSSTMSSSFEGIGFAIPSTGATQIINELITNGKVTSYPSDGYVQGAAKLGIQCLTVTDEVRTQYRLGDDVPDGVFVVSVTWDTAVNREGLSAYDIITEFNGKKVETSEELVEMLGKCKAGEEASLKFYRPNRKSAADGETFSITFILDSQS